MLMRGRLFCSVADRGWLRLRKMFWPTSASICAPSVRCVHNVHNVHNVHCVHSVHAGVFRRSARLSLMPAPAVGAAVASVSACVFLRQAGRVQPPSDRGRRAAIRSMRWLWERQPWAWLVFPPRVRRPLLRPQAWRTAGRPDCRRREAASRQADPAWLS